MFSPILPGFVVRRPHRAYAKEMNSNPFTRTPFNHEYHSPVSGNLGHSNKGKPSQSVESVVGLDRVNNFLQVCVWRMAAALQGIGSGYLQVRFGFL